MRTQTRSLTFALIAAFAIAGCGDDNGNNENDNGGTTSPTRTPTPVVATATSTPGGTANPTVTATPNGGNETPTPTPTQTPGTTLACNGEGAALSVTITTLAGSDLDTGYTGISHNTVATHENTVTTDLNCIGNDCTVDGSALVGKAFGSPLPLASGGIAVCVLNTFREAITGTYNCTTGCSQSSVKIVSSVFLVTDQPMPCPACVGDATPNDGVKGGTCNGGTTSGAACDVNGISDLFQDAAGAPPDAGQTSNDCLPTGSSVAELDIDLNPLTSGTASVSANVDCLDASSPAGSCYCPGQLRPNSCIGDGVCGATGVCEQNPPVGRCAGQTYRSCRPTQGSKDCEDRFPGAGSCIAQQPACFGTTISRSGTCGTETGSLAAVFCIGETRAEAINATSGLPGPGAITLPGRQVRTPR